jgi:hypothetical protein
VERGAAHTQMLPDAPLIPRLHGCVQASLLPRPCLVFPSRSPLGDAMQSRPSPPLPSLTKVARYIPGRTGQQCAQRWRHKVSVWAGRDVTRVCCVPEDDAALEAQSSPASARLPAAQPTYLTLHLGSALPTGRVLLPPTP